MGGGLLLHGAWRLAGRPSPWPRWFLGTAARIIGADPHVVGTPLQRDVLFVANHLSWMDIPLIAGATGSAFVGKAELADHPAARWLCGLNHTVLVRREDRLGVAGQIGRVRTALASGRPLTLFPEGTTGDDATLLPFKAALLAVLDDPPPGIRVQPVRLSYGAAIDPLGWFGAESGGSHAARVLRRRGRFRVALTFCEPFDPAGFSGRKAIAAEARRRIEVAG